MTGMWGQQLRPIDAPLVLRLSHWLLGLTQEVLWCRAWSWLRGMHYTVVPSVNVVDVVVVVVVKWESASRKKSNDIFIADICDG